jgi:hypothetical protein
MVVQTTKQQTGWQYRLQGNKLVGSIDYTATHWLAIYVDYKATDWLKIYTTKATN